MLSKLLKEKSQRLEFSSRQVADKVGVSHATILRVLKGEIVDLETLIKLSDWLGVKPSTMLNSLRSSPDVLADRVAVVVERHPKLADVFSKALKAIDDNDANLDLIEDIASYAAYKLNIYPKSTAR